MTEEGAEQQVKAMQERYALLLQRFGTMYAKVQMLASDFNAIVELHNKTEERSAARQEEKKE